MPSGRLGAIVVIPNQWNPLFTCAVGKCGTFNLTVINQTGLGAQIKVALIDSANVADYAPQDQIDAPVDKLVGGGGLYRLTGEPIGNVHGATAETLAVWSDRAVTAHARGFIGDPVHGEG
ncbi:MAG: hypothetical protein LCH79_16160 [Proteobacteria bacterium]|nr:hypothetical protein [Pseudomonadota bacterium]